ncbi:MAG: hypothetical protein WC998_08310 [Candidatus Paceibacterota bacterium]
MKRISIVLGIMVMMLCLNGCATQWCNVHPEWNPINGQTEADARCKAQSYAFTDNAIDIIMHTPRRVYTGCMAQYGYNRCRVVDEKNK